MKPSFTEGWQMSNLLGVCLRAVLQAACQVRARRGCARACGAAAVDEGHESVDDGHMHGVQHALRLRQDRLKSRPRRRVPLPTCACPTLTLSAHAICHEARGLLAGIPSMKWPVERQAAVHCARAPSLCCLFSRKARQADGACVRTCRGAAAWQGTCSCC